jgi:hypothetical protein
MNESGVLVQNCRLFRTTFDDRQLFVKHMQKEITLCHCDYLEDISTHTVDCNIPVDWNIPAFAKRLAVKLAGKWQKPYSQVCGSVNARLSIAAVRGGCGKSRFDTATDRGRGWKLRESVGSVIESARKSLASL